MYVGQPSAVGEPPKNLRGFTRISLNPGQTQHVALTLDARSFQYWNNGWTNAAGTNTVYVGSSSRDIRLTGTTTIGGGGGGGGGGTQTALPRTGWTVTASSTGGGDVPANMLDGNTGTRWSTGTPMANGQSLHPGPGLGAEHRPDRDGLGRQRERLRPRLPGLRLDRRRPTSAPRSPPAPAPPPR